MMNIEKLLIIGGDNRQKYMAESLCKKGLDVYIYGFENLKNFKDLKEIAKEDILEKIPSFDAVILPLPVSRDNKNIIMEKGTMSILELSQMLGANQIVFAGLMDRDLKSLFFKRGIKVFDYFEREELKINNAFATAQGVLKIILNEIPISLNRIKCCVTGCGKCAGAIGKMLESLGADVTLAARKCSDLAWSRNNKMKAVYIKDLKSFAENFDVIINTVPAHIIDDRVLRRVKKSCILIEIASKPYDMDEKLIEQYDLRLIKAPSLPGKTVPKTAGDIIADTVFNIIKEGNL